MHYLIVTMRLSGGVRGGLKQVNNLSSNPSINPFWGLRSKRYSERMLSYSAQLLKHQTGIGTAKTKAIRHGCINRMVE